MFTRFNPNVLTQYSILQHIRITNLTKGTLYEVKVQGATRSLTESTKLYRGEFSEPRKVILQSKCISKFYPFPFHINHVSYFPCDQTETVLDRGRSIVLLLLSLFLFDFAAGLDCWRILSVNCMTE